MTHAGVYKYRNNWKQLLLIDLHESTSGITNRTPNINTLEIYVSSSVLTAILMCE